MKIRVYYEDTDSGGVVYHSNYLNFCERARSEVFFEKDMTPALSDAHFVATSLEAKYIYPARLGDLLHVKTTLLEMKGASFMLEHSIEIEGKEIFRMKIRLAYIGYDGRVKMMQKEIKQLIKELFV